ncbi:MAG TPA: SdrD B-like domain-containing protein, partial [Alphaproteobacteria bacterium]|nr:SdrD B-like domain-containing protein [Alphaproteobacteria bacterium]
PASSQLSSSTDFGLPNNVSANVIINGADNEMVDFGFFIPKGTIGGLVWNESNWDGIKDEDEEGLAGVNVSLYNELTNEFVISVFSNKTGNYTFEVPSGNYKVITGKNQELYERKDGNMVLRIISLTYDECNWWPTIPGKNSYDHNGASVVLNRDNLENLTVDFGYVRNC